MCFEKDGAFFRTLLTDGAWSIEGDININGVEKDNELSVSVGLTDANGREIESTLIDAQSLTHFNILVENPKLWTPENPYLYNIKCTLLRGKEAVDS